MQTSFAVLMLVGGVSPCLCSWPIVKIKFQGKYQGFETDDLIVYTEQPNTGRQAKLLGQIKHSVNIINSNKEFCEVIQAAWKDFNNRDIFNEGTDAIALICGPLSAIDTNDVRRLLDQARASENSEDFITRIERANFTSNNQRKKFEIFKSQLKFANKNVELTNDQLWRFLRSFHLLIYDLDIEGVTLSLLYTLIEQHSRNNADALWNQIKNHVERESENAGFVTLNSIPEEIRSQFKLTPIEVIPEEFVKGTLEVKDWNLYRYANELAIASIIGSWDENSENDKFIVSTLVREDYKNWIQKLREVLQEPESPLILKNGIWSVRNRKQLWKSVGSRIFDENLDSFKQCIVLVLTEYDPQFELSVDQRFAASIYGKVLKYSNSLRKGLTEGLALLGCCSDVLINCSMDKAENTVILSIREIFNNPDWMLWASLNSLLPIIAEAAPDEFLKAVDNSLHNAPCPFNALFPQKETGIMGSNHITGLLWALEKLAWEEEFLVRVTIVLGELARIDPGSNWSNRPSNSLTEIFLPWHPQTIASIEKRRVAIQTLNKELPDVAWNLLISLLPRYHQIAHGSSKPVFRNSIPDNWTVGVTNEEYCEQALFYADFLVEQAKYNIIKLNKMVNELDNLPKSAFDKLLLYLSSDYVISKPENAKLELWNQLINFTSRHERFSDAEWTLDSTVISKIKEVASRLEPKNPIYVYSRLFNNGSFDFFEKEKDYQTQAQKLEEHRQQALKTIIDYGGIDAVFQLLEIVESPSDVGWSLGNIAEDSFDKIILPEQLIIDSKKIEQFTSRYVWNKHRKFGWKWVDSIRIEEWPIPQIARFLTYLPFTQGTWERVSKILSDNEAEYWNQTNANPYETNSGFDFAIDKLLKHNRPYAAIDCIHKSIYDKQPLNKDITIQALIKAISSPEPKHNMNTYHTVEIIKLLQDNNTTNPDDLFRIEWAYLPLLDGDNGVRPKLLEERLATDPNFFCEAMRLAYRSKNDTEENKELNREEKAVISNVWDLLGNWHRPPGLKNDGCFDSQKFIDWLEETKKICTESGHLEVALLNVGKVLFHCPPDPDGFWINRGVADILNEKDSEEMRNGLYTQIRNSRGVHWVDPTAKPEKDFALKYRRQAEDTENAGYQRLADILRGVAESYERDAERIIDRNKSENDE